MTWKLPLNFMKTSWAWSLFHPLFLTTRLLSSKSNEKQQLHLSEWEDAQSFRGHVCLDVDDFDDLFFRFNELGIIDIKPWGNVRQMPDGAMQMFVRDPAGNLVELISRPTYKSDQRVFNDELFKEGIYVSGRNDFRGYKSDEATLYHEENAS